MAQFTVGYGKRCWYCDWIYFFAATILYVLQFLGALNLPIIGDYIADIVRIVQIQLEGKGY